MMTTHHASKNNSTSEQQTHQDQGEETWDSIVIGSGIGGMTVASLLSQSRPGHRVLVLEQGEQLGGGCQTLTGSNKDNNKDDADNEKSQFEFGIGVHYVGEMQTDSTARRMLDALTPSTQPVEWNRMDDVFDSVFFMNNNNGEGFNNNRDGGTNNNDISVKRFDMVANRQEEALNAQFQGNPHDQKAIKLYFRYIRQANRAIRRSLLWKALPYSVAKWWWRSHIVQNDKKNNSWLQQLWPKSSRRPYPKWASQTVEQVVDGIIPTQNSCSPRLRDVLLYAWCDYGTAPSEAPFVVHALLTMHYTDGAFYPVGGPAQIPRRIAAVISAAGGELRTRQRVQEIWVEDEEQQREIDNHNGRPTSNKRHKNKKPKVAGVILENGKRIRATNVISNAGMVNTYQYLLPKDIIAKQQKSTAAAAAVARTDNSDSSRKLAATDNITKNKSQLQNGMTGLYLFVGLEGSPDRDLNLPKQQIWAFWDDDDEKNKKKEQPMESSSDETSKQTKEDSLPIFIGSPSVKDPDTWAQQRPNVSSLEILTPAPWEWFADHLQDSDNDDETRKEKFQQWKQKLAQEVWQKSRHVLVAAGASEAKLPQQLTDVAHYQFGTPLDFSRHLGSNRGACYGLDHNLERFAPENYFLKLRPDSLAQTTVEGLYLSGQDTVMCGMAGAMIGGYLCASHVLGGGLKNNPLSLLKQVNRGRVKFCPSLEVYNDTDNDSTEDDNQD